MFVCTNQLLLFNRLVFSEIVVAMATALHIIVGHHNVVDWLLLFIYIMRTLPTHYCLESSAWVAYMKPHP